MGVRSKVLQYYSLVTNQSFHVTGVLYRYLHLNRTYERWIWNSVLRRTVGCAGQYSSMHFTLWEYQVRIRAPYLRTNSEYQVQCTCTV